MRLSNVILRVSDLADARLCSGVTWSGSTCAGQATSSPSSPSARASSLSISHLVFEDQTSETEIVFEVEDVHSVISEMRERGVPFDVEPRAVTSDGERTLFASHFRDPDGHVASVTGWVEGAE